jgi:hypothetical protein
VNTGTCTPATSGKRHNEGHQQRQAETRTLRWLLPLVLAIAAAAALFARFHAGAGLLAFYDDDFFYYLRIAQHIVAGHGSTYDGVHLTNGYHPLWMLVMVVLTRCFGSGTVFFCALQTVLLLCIVATYGMCARTLTAFASGAAWLPQLIAAALATSTLMLAAGGMEVALAIPLITALAYYRLCHFSWRPRSAFLLGLLGAAVVLARLDAAILVITLGVLDVLFAIDVSLRDRLRCAVTFLVGASPVAIYILLNELWFHTPMPVSGQAKQLRFHHWPSLIMFSRAAFAPPQRYFLIYPLLAITIAALAILASRPSVRRHPLLRGRIPCLLALLLFPFLFAATLSVVSDWPIWPWYGYPLIASGLGAAVLLLTIAAVPAKASVRRLSTVSWNLLRWPALALLVMIWTAYAVVQWRNATRPDKVGYSLYLQGVDIARFAQTHPGTYAMGDRAGTPGYLLHDPLVQLEGLTMDVTFLKNIQAERPLLEVLRSYGVRYYIATNPEFHDGCWRTVEPLVAGSDAPHMRGLLCMQPAAQFFHSGYNSVIFDLDTRAVSTQ